MGRLIKGGEVGRPDGKNLKILDLHRLATLYADCWVGKINGFNTSSTFDSTNLHQRTRIQPAAVTACIDMDMGTS